MNVATRQDVSIIKFWNNKNTFFSHTNILSDLDIRILEVRTTDFVISKKKFIDFMDELGLFIEEKPICKKKNFPSLCRLPRKVWLPTSTLPVQLRDFFFWISE
jgi:hypothetical protein